MIDYSKFDNIELSDDSDVEVHPNVDKASFIKWKQRDIHEKRAQRNAQINQITVNLAMYSHLNDRVDAILGEPVVDLSNEAQAFAFLNSKFDKNETFQSELVDPSETLPYNEQIEDLIIQLRHDLLKESKDVTNDNLRELLTKHKKKIDDLIVEQEATLARLKEEKASHIEMDDLREGFSSTIINKGDAKEPAAVPSSSRKQVVETINSPVSKPLKNEPIPSKPLDQLEELELLEETARFEEIPTDDLGQLHGYLATHLYIVTEQQKDALLMTAFDAELEDNHEKAKSIVHKALLLRFADELLKPIKNKDAKLSSLNTFFSRIRDKNHPASKAFAQEVAFTYNHIKTRSKVIREEESKRASANGGDEEEEEALIQLKSTDDNTALTVDLPTEDDTERYELFKQLPEDLQTALKTENMDEVNKVFAKLKVAEAEEYLEIMNIAGIIGVEVLENEQEFEELKKTLHKSNLEEIDELEANDDDVVLHKSKEVDEEEEELSTADIVD